jgi:hypothetical protein
MWWKVTCAADGAVRSCEMVSGRQENGDYVYYVEADNKTAAVKAAQKVHHAAYNAAYNAGLRAKQREAGLCTVARCKSVPMCGKKMCGPHLKQFSEYCKNRRASRAAGVAPRPMVKDRATEDQAAAWDRLAKSKRATERRSLAGARLRTLVEARQAYDSMSRVAFGKWLDDEIAKCEGEREAQAAE